MKSLIHPSGGRGENMGIMIATSNVEPKTTYGVTVKIQEAVDETSASFRKSLSKSKYAWESGGPFLFCSRAFVFRTMPVTNGGSARTTASCTIQIAAVINRSSILSEVSIPEVSLEKILMVHV